MGNQNKYRSMQSSILMSSHCKRKRNSASSRLKDKSENPAVEDPSERGEVCPPSERFIVGQTDEDRELVAVEDWLARMVRATSDLLERTGRSPPEYGTGNKWR
jgi:hypothetical protein